MSKVTKGRPKLSAPKSEPGAEWLALLRRCEREIAQQQALCRGKDAGCLADTPLPPRGKRVLARLSAALDRSSPAQ